MSCFYCVFIVKRVFPRQRMSFLFYSYGDNFNKTACKMFLAYFFYCFWFSINLNKSNIGIKKTVNYKVYHHMWKKNVLTKKFYCRKTINDNLNGYFYLCLCIFLNFLSDINLFCLPAFSLFLLLKVFLMFVTIVPLNLCFLFETSAAS